MPDARHYSSDDSGMSAPELFLEAAREVADWCDHRKTQTLNEARKQIRTVWWLLGVGVIMLLAMPRLVAYVDYIAADLPSETVEVANIALENVKKNEKGMKLDLERAESELQGLKEELSKKITEVEVAETQYFGPFENSFSVWRRSKALVSVYEINTFFETSSGVFIAAGSEVTRRGEKVLFLRSTDGKTWYPLGPSFEEDRQNGVVRGIEKLTSGGFVAIGSTYDADNNSRPLTMYSGDGESWSSVVISSSETLLTGRLNSITKNSQGELFAAGYINTGDGDKTLLLKWSLDGELDREFDGAQYQGRLQGLVHINDFGLIAFGEEDTKDGTQTLLLRSVDGNSWENLPLTSRGERVNGIVYSLIRLRNGTLFAFGAEAGLGGAPLLLRSTDASDWEEIAAEFRQQHTLGELSTAIEAPDGGIYVAGSIGIDDNVLLRSKDGLDWTSVQLTNSQPVGKVGPFRELFLTGSGGFLGAFRDGSIASPAPEERLSVAQAVLTGEIFGSDLLYPFNTKEQSRLLIAAREAERNTRIRTTTQEQLQQSLSDRHSLQVKVVDGVSLVTQGLKEALNQSEPVRQAGWIATRLGVVALIIYLTQIVVNRYRYLQRLADFYDGRAQAFRMLSRSGSSAAGALLQNVSFNELMSGLSPSAISFGKSPEPPTQELMSMLQVAAKR